MLTIEILTMLTQTMFIMFIGIWIHVKSSFPKRYKSILIVFMKMAFFLPRPIHFVNIQFILLKWSVGSV